MKYTRLTKEQLEDLHQEFINFLATQSITGAEWEHIKVKQPEVAEEEIDIFSDLVWEGALQQAKYLQHNVADQLYLFKLTNDTIDLILVKVLDTTVDLTTKKGFIWLQSNIQEDSVELFTASKAYPEDRNLGIFQLIQQGAEITDGNLYEQFSKLIN